MAYTLDTKTYSFSELAKKYSEMLAPMSEVLVNNNDLAKKPEIAIESVIVEQTVEHKADSATVTIGEVYDLEAGDLHEAVSGILPGQTLEIKLGYVDKAVTVFSGLVTSITYDYTDGSGVRAVVRGMDYSFNLMGGAHSKVFTKKKLSDIVKEIAGEHALTPKIDNTTDVHETVIQTGKDDFRFISDIANWIGYDFFVVGKTLHFRKPLSDTSPLIELKYGMELRRFTLEANISGQLAEAEVRGWDVKEQKELVSKSPAVTKLGSQPKTGSTLMKTISGGTFKETEYTSYAVKSLLDERAKAILQSRSMLLISGSGECIGLPEIQAGRCIKLTGLGKKLNETYYLTSVTHTFDASEGYVTSFTVGGNAI